MSLLSVSNLSQCFAEKTLYENASFDLFKGEHMGVVGQNGVGKSTLINILMGDVIPDKGEIKWHPHIKIGHLDQYAQADEGYTIMEYLKTAFAELFDMENKMNLLYDKVALTCDESDLLKASEYQEQLLAKDFYSVDSNINRVIFGLGINAMGTDNIMGELSGGQRAKIILAKLLLQKPDVLLLDEPTNFLDAEHITWLSDYLVAFEGAFIVISHDFGFLERVTNCICDIEFGTIKVYYGKYSEFVRQKKHLREDYIRQYTSQQKEIKRTEEFIRRNIAGVNTKMAQGRRKQLERLERIAPPSFNAKPFINFRGMPLSAHNALSVKNLEVGYEYALLPKLNFSVASGEKLVITGFNGIGKSTLLKTLVGAVPCLDGSFHFSPQVKVNYYEQDLRWLDETRTPLQIISDKYPKLTVKEVRKFLSGCGVKDDHVSQTVGTLSGGEQSKVKLCRMIISPCNFLVLDEPTNHLDAQTKESLQEALIQFSGSVILVSHEESFYASWADKILDISEILNSAAAE